MSSAPPFSQAAQADGETEARLADLLKQVRDASDGGMRRRALRLASEYRDVCLATFGRAHFRYASALNTLGFVHKVRLACLCLARPATEPAAPGVAGRRGSARRFAWRFPATPLQPLSSRFDARLWYRFPQNRGEVALAVGSYAGALALLGQSAEGRATPSWAAVAANVGACYRSMAEGARSGWERMLLLETGLAYLAESLAVRERCLDPQDPALGETLSLIGGAMRAASDEDIAARGGGDVLAAAERVARRAVAHLASAPAAHPTSVATASANLAVLLMQDLPTPDGAPPSGDMAEALAAAQRSRSGEAEALLRDALTARRGHLGEIHPTTIETLLLLAQAVERAGATGASTEAEVATLRATADELYAELRDLQAEDEAADDRA